MSGTSIIGSVLIALSVAYAFVYPSLGDISDLTAEKERYANSLAEVMEIENRKNELLTRFNNISEEDKKEINTVLPTSFNFIRLVSQIDAVAAKHGISIDKISSRELSPSVGGSIESAQPAKPYRSAVVSFNFESSYDKFVAFVGELGKSMRILDARSVKLSTGKDIINSYEVEFETYWLK